MQGKMKANAGWKNLLLFFELLHHIVYAFFSFYKIYNKYINECSKFFNHN